MFGGIRDASIWSDHHQVAASNLRFGEGVTAEVGMDLKNMKARKVRPCPPARSSSTISHSRRIGRSVYRPQCGKVDRDEKRTPSDPLFPPQTLNPTTLRRLPLWNPKPTSHSKCTTKVCVVPKQNECTFSLRYGIAAVVSEPTEASWRDAIVWARSHDISHFLACAGRPPHFQTTC